MIALVAAAFATTATAQVTLANPHWNIWLTDSGYSDFMLDNTPGFEGREYLSGEWGGAVAYVANGAPVQPQWFEPRFLFPDWNTGTSFTTKTAIAQVGINVDGLPIAESVLANNDLEVTLRFEMIDTVVGTPMGAAADSDGGAGNHVTSSRYVLQQTYTLKNISGSTLSDVQLFQFLHGLQSERGVYDGRLYAGTLGHFRHDTTLAGVDAYAVSAGSSSAGLEDFISFHATTAPDAHEIGYYGIEGNGLDDHSIGKPSDGVHLSVENNWTSTPYSTRLGTDSFAPSHRWIAGAQRWTLGSLAPGQSTSFDVLLSILTGTKVTSGTGSTGGCNGGSSVPGGVDYEFEDVSSEGSCFGEFSKADDDEIAIRVAAGEIDPISFMTPGGPVQFWKLEFSGSYSGNIHLTFAYDPSALPPGFDESTLCLYEYNGAWQQLACIVDTTLNTITVTTPTLSTFALGTEGGVTFNISASASPAGSGTVAGEGTFASGSLVTLEAVAAPGYVFSSWTENGTPVSTSPGYAFNASDDRTLVAQFTAAGTGVVVATTSKPLNGGTTTGDGEYAPGSIATVEATAAPGYKFSKWLLNGVNVSSARIYNFTATSNVSLAAKFKPVYTIITSADPEVGGEISADTLFEPGEVAVLKAKPNDGYSFVNWTQNGVEVSDATNFTFTVTGNRTLVAHFALGHRIDVTALPANAGTVSGGGVYPDGSIAAVEAIAHPGYVFVNWTEGETPIGIDPALDVVSDGPHTVVANFIAQPGVHDIGTADNSLSLAWPAASGWILQHCADLGSTNWVTVTNDVTTLNNENSTQIPNGDGAGFFRLVHP